MGKHPTYKPGDKAGRSAQVEIIRHGHRTGIQRMVANVSLIHPH